MDLFGRKRITKLEADIRTAQWRENTSEHNYQVVCKERDTLIKTLRDQDQLIYLMSQCTDWPSMRPHFNKLQSATESRMRLESDRIRDVLIPEVRKAYTQQKQTTIEYPIDFKQIGTERK